MAESVDASVSNTDGAIRAGSTPAQGTDTGSGAIRSPFCVPPTLNSSFFTIQDHKLHIGFTI